MYCFVFEVVVGQVVAGVVGGLGWVVGCVFFGLFVEFCLRSGSMVQSLGAAAEPNGLEGRLPCKAGTAQPRARARARIAERLFVP